MLKFYDAKKIIDPKILLYKKSKLLCIHIVNCVQPYRTEEKQIIQIQNPHKSRILIVPRPISQHYLKEMYKLICGLNRYKCTPHMPLID